MNAKMNAKRLRMILMITIFLVIAAVTGGFFYAHKNLSKYATEISQLNADADSGDQSIAALRELEARLEKEKPTIEAARSIVADNATFAERVVSDVTQIAAQSGVTITSLEYVDTAAAPATAPAAAATPAPVPTVPGQPTTAAPTGVTKKSISVTIESPLEYTKLLNFIKNIESNNLKLQIATVTMKKEAGNKIGTQTFSIGAYVR